MCAQGILCNWVREVKGLDVFWRKVGIFVEECCLGKPRRVNAAAKLCPALGRVLE
jgi:hypothetical protein